MSLCGWYNPEREKSERKSGDQWLSPRKPQHWRIERRKRMASWRGNQRREWKLRKESVLGEGGWQQRQMQPWGFSRTRIDSLLIWGHWGSSWKYQSFLVKIGKWDSDESGLKNEWKMNKWNTCGHLLGWIKYHINKIKLRWETGSKVWLYAFENVFLEKIFFLQIKKRKYTNCRKFGGYENWWKVKVIRDFSWTKRLLQ